MTNSGSSYESYAYGGAIYGSSVLNIEGGSFVNCSSVKPSSGNPMGGSIYADSSSTCNITSASFVNCSAVTNSASDSARGGAVCTYTSSTSNITNTSFVNCSAVWSVI